MEGTQELGHRGGCQAREAAQYGARDSRLTHSGLTWPLTLIYPTLMTAKHTNIPSAAAKAKSRRQPAEISSSKIRSTQTQRNSRSVEVLKKEFYYQDMCRPKDNMCDWTEPALNLMAIHWVSTVSAAGFYSYKRWLFASSHYKTHTLDPNKHWGEMRHQWRLSHIICLLEMLTVFTHIFTLVIR